MKRLTLLIQTLKQSIAAVETPAKKIEQLEWAKTFAAEFLTGIWLQLFLQVANQIEKTIPNA